MVAAGKSGWVERCSHRLQFVGLLACSWLGACDSECRSLETCDIRDSDCQEDVATWLQCVRGGAAPRPAVQVISPTAYRERVLALRADRESTAEHDEIWNRALAQYELAPAVYDADNQLNDQLSMTAAAYFLDSRKVVVIDRGESMNSRQSVAILAHEFVHAAQDAELKLSDYQKRETWDASLAVKGLIEGEAVHYQLLAQLDQAGRAPTEVNWAQTYSDWRSEALNEAVQDEAPFNMARLRFPYAFGGGYVAQLWLARGRFGIDERLEQPPLTTREIMFGPAEVDVQPILQQVRAHGQPVLADSFEAQGVATMGAWMARMHARKLDQSVRLKPVQALAADVFSVQRDTLTGQLMSTWHVSMFPAASLPVWPGAERPRTASWRPVGSQDTYVVNATLGVPPRPEALEWISVDEAPMPDMGMDMDAASRAGAWPCALKTPGLVFNRP